MTLLMVSGTGTDVGKTVATAAVTALGMAQGRSVVVVKLAQTGLLPGQDGDIAEVVRLAGPTATRELARYPEPLAPATAARRAGMPPLRLAYAIATVRALRADHDLVLVEGAGGLLAWFDDEGWTLADLATALDAPVLIVAAAGLGTLNNTALTTEALRRRDLRCAGVLIGSWPADPDLAMRCNLTDLPMVSGVPLVGALPEGMATLDRAAFAVAAGNGLAPALGGNFELETFAASYAG
jgi:dethiobiotin synthetase